MNEKQQKLYDAISEFAPKENVKTTTSTVYLLRNQHTLMWFRAWDTSKVFVTKNIDKAAVYEIAEDWFYWIDYWNMGDEWLVVAVTKKVTVELIL